MYFAVSIKDSETGTWERPWCVYQSGSEYTDISYRYGSANNFHLNMPSASYYGTGVLDFRVQAVAGYFVFSGYVTVDPIYEGEGSAFTEFTITLPSPNNPGTSFPDIQYPSGTPLTSNVFSPPATSKPNSSQSAPQQTPSQFNTAIVMVLVALCIIAVLMTATAFLFKQRKTKDTYYPNSNCNCSISSIISGFDVFNINFYSI